MVSGFVGPEVDILGSYFIEIEKMKIMNIKWGKLVCNQK